MMKRFALGALVLLYGAGTAAAAPLVLPSNAPVYFQFNNLEQTNLANTLVVPGGYYQAGGVDIPSGNWGVFNISTVQKGGIVAPHIDISGGTPFFTDAGPGGGQITGIFFGSTFTSPTTATNGFIDVYWHDAGAVDAACLAGGCLPNAATVTEFTTGNGGVFLARLKFDSGIDPLNATTFTKSNIDPTTPGGSGHADSFISVDLTKPGLWSAGLDGDWFNTAFGTRDLRFSNFFNVDVASWSAPGGTAGVRSNDPGRVFTTATVPEPATLTLLGLGLASLGARRRKKA